MDHQYQLVDLLIQHTYPPGFIHFLSRYQEMADCPNCEGTGEEVFGITFVGDAIQTILTQDCEICESRGWVYVVTLN